KVGLNVAINSDDAEMARRLNQEAAKSVKYGGISEEDALKMVTINPAKMLHVDDRVGSIKEGKDADLVLW
ncbi:amidohydrolase family protein, partial [Vibrio parahaemolyticus]